MDAVKNSQESICSTDTLLSALQTVLYRTTSREPHTFTSFFKL
uniref:Uncharacterized protein n=1 Tax=Anguilla anguilla TaxID=7936 RepID=A0A0E9VVC0_ANGAN